MGESGMTGRGLAFDRRLRIEFQGARISSDGGLLAIQELDETLGLSRSAAEVLQEGRTGSNIRHELLPLLRQSIYSRLAGYEDVNDAERLARDPVMRTITGKREFRVASASQGRPDREMPPARSSAAQK